MHTFLKCSTAVRSLFALLFIVLGTSLTSAQLTVDQTPRFRLEASAGMSRASFNTMPLFGLDAGSADGSAKRFTGGSLDVSLGLSYRLKNRVVLSTRYSSGAYSSSEAVLTQPPATAPTFGVLNATSVRTQRFDLNVGRAFGTGRWTFTPSVGLSLSAYDARTTSIPHDFTGVGFTFAQFLLKPVFDNGIEGPSFVEAPGTARLPRSLTNTSLNFGYNASFSIDYALNRHLALTSRLNVAGDRSQLSVGASAGLVVRF